MNITHIQHEMGLILLCVIAAAWLRQTAGLYAQLRTIMFFLNNCAMKVFFLIITFCLFIYFI